MKCSEAWLREWVNPAISRDELANTLTMAGLEVEAIESVGNDHTIDISITPNRGDCLSVRGIAREVSALTSTPLHEITIPDIKATNTDKIPVYVDAKDGCPRYLARIMRGVKADATSPDWLCERLASAGLHSISAIVDVANYVMLELGQPMHAFDLQKINREIRVRLSKTGERIALLDGTEKELDDQTLVIADKKNPLAIAGVMGGLDSGVTLLTTDILLESAFFAPKTIARQRQHYQLNSDSAYRFERGVDFTIQRQAIERATQLILDICGGEAGEVIEKTNKATLPKAITVTLKKDKITKLLGVTIPDTDINSIFSRLGFQFKNKWQVKIPPYRFDLTLPEDLIEEITRLYGYDNIPTHTMQAELRVPTSHDTGPYLQKVKQAFSHQGYHEIISYSFVDKTLQALLNPHEVAQELVNPMTADMEVMRTNLWPGLINTLRYNKSRQQSRIRLFEVGSCFLLRHHQLSQEPKVAGLVTGLVQQEQWGTPAKNADFFDLKGNIENILSINYNFDEITFKPESHPALHPTQSAGIYYQDKKIGIMGALHPSILQKLDITDKTYVFELDIPEKICLNTRQVQEISKFPEIRRDLALLVNETVPAGQIQDTIKECAGDWLKESFIFDVYQGKGIAPSQKSIALALVLQHPTRTLVDSEVAEIVDRVLKALNGKLGAALRS